MRWNNLPAQLLICEPSKEESEEGTIGVQGKLPLNIFRGHIDYFELKLLEKQPVWGDDIKKSL